MRLPSRPVPSQEPCTVFMKAQRSGGGGAAGFGAGGGSSGALISSGIGGGGGSSAAAAARTNGAASMSRDRPGHGADAGGRHSAGSVGGSPRARATVSTIRSNMATSGGPGSADEHRFGGLLPPRGRGGQDDLLNLGVPRVLARREDRFLPDALLVPRG